MNHGHCESFYGVQILMQPTPIFLFSLPRSGSTLLQKLLLSSKEIASISESWILLPILYSVKREGVAAEYGHPGLYQAVQEFIQVLPDKEEDYYSAVRAFSQVLYSKACSGDVSYFLDKIPQYFLIIPLITKVYPDAKFIFLFRNPLDVFSSVVKTFNGGSLRRMDYYDKVLFEGYRYLAEGFQEIGQKSIALRYEDLIGNPSEKMEEVFRYLDLEYDEDALKSFFRSELKGTFGDPNVRGDEKYATIVVDNKKVYRERIGSNLRKNLLARYTAMVDESALDILGYSKEELLREVESLETQSQFALKDRICLLETWLIRKVRKIMGWKALW